MDREIEEQWQITKDSYPEAVIFFEADGLFYVRGNDVAILSKEFSIACNGGWIGFSDGEARCYMIELAKRGHSVIRASADRAVEVRPESGRRKEIEEQRAKGNFLAIDPTLIFDKAEIDPERNARWLRKTGNDDLFDRCKDWLSNGAPTQLRELGELCVIEAGNGWYDFDYELTTMLRSHIIVVAMAALATGHKIPCRVVQPKCRRQRRVQTIQQIAPEPIRFGQLRFDL